MLNEEKKWYEKAGKESDVVISTRVRLARNLADMPFPNRMTPDQKAAVERRVRDAILSGNSAIASDFDFVQMDDLSNEQAVSLVEPTVFIFQEVGIFFCRKAFFKLLIDTHFSLRKSASIRKNSVDNLLRKSKGRNQNECH